MWGAALEISRLVFAALWNLFSSHQSCASKSKSGANYWEGTSLAVGGGSLEIPAFTRLWPASISLWLRLRSIRQPLFPWFFCLRQKSATESHSGTSSACRPHAGLGGSNCSDYVFFLRLWCTITAKSVIIRNRQCCFCKQSGFFFVVLNTKQLSIIPYPGCFSTTVVFIRVSLLCLSRVLSSLLCNLILSLSCSVAPLPTEGSSLTLTLTPPTLSTSVCFGMMNVCSPLVGEVSPASSMSH